MKRTLITFLIVTVYLGGCKNGGEEATAVVHSISESVYASGVVKSANQYDLFSSVNGRVKTILVEEGDTVQKDQPLVYIEATPAQLNVRNASLNANKAKLANNKTKLDAALLAVQLARTRMINDSLLWIRQQNLWSQSIGTRVELEQRELAYTSSSTAHRNAAFNYSDMLRDLQYNSDQANTVLEINRSIAGDYIISAIAQGRVYEINKHVGEYVTTVAPIATLGDATRFIIELNVDESDVERVKKGQKVFITMDSYKGRAFEGAIYFIEPMMNEDSRTFLVKVEFTKAPPRLFPNLTVEANILVNHRDSALVIPTRFIESDSTVIMKDGTLQKIETGLKDYEWTEITKGLRAGDIIQRQFR